MTIIEFYDKSSIENIAGALLTNAERVIFVGDKRNAMERSIGFYTKILEKRGKRTEFDYVSLNRNNLWEIVEKLSAIIEKYDDCVFDLTGGEDLYLVATGVLAERYRGRIQCHRFNFSNSHVIDCDDDGNVIDLNPFDISIEENLMLYGGKIVRDPISDACTFDYSFSESFTRDVERMWQLAKRNLKIWNGQCFAFKALCKKFRKSELFAASFTFAEAEDALDGNPFFIENDLTCELETLGLISITKLGASITLAFKNEEIMNVLTGAGRVLEVFIASRIKRLTDKRGNYVYGDVASGIVVNWELDGDDTSNPTINEIDVIAMKDAIPIFISCKTGTYDANEIYKLHTVSEHFGNKYAKCAIISASADAIGERLPFLKARAKEMNIEIIENVDMMDDKDLNKTLENLYKNK